MRIAILSGGNGWHVRDLKRAANELGHAVETLDFRTVQATVGLDGDAFDRFDAVIVRTMPPGSLEQVVFRMDVLHKLHSAGVRVINSPRALEICIDKYLALVRLQTAGLRVPETIVCQTADDALAAFERLGRDVVIKPIFGSEGRGMMHITDLELAWRSLRAIERTQSVIYLQKFIAHPGWDLRAFVLNGKILAAIRRQSNGDWRTNVAQGATAEPTTLSPELGELAIRAASAVGVFAGGVDLLQGPNGEWYVIEVNAVPGWKALGPTTGVDVAKMILEAVGANDVSPSPAYESLQSALVRACVWEATAYKAGNVHPGASFAEMTYADFMMSATAAAPALALAASRPLGETILAAIRATRFVVNCNTNLGIVLLLAPLAAVPEGEDMGAGVLSVLNRTSLADAELVYEAIRLASPGGIGSSDQQDVREAPTVTLREAMEIASDRDMVARQYANGYRDIIEFGVPALLDGTRRYQRLEPAIQHCQLSWLTNYADSLIVRKRGQETAAEASRRAASVLATDLRTESGKAAFDDFDRWLRADGHARNPGTTADLVTACLFVALRQRSMMIDIPM